MKTRVIDLLNKIAKGEEVPKKIKIKGYKFKLSDNYKDYNINYAYEDYFDNYWLDCIGINEEIEIIEEDKEIEELDLEWFKQVDMFEPKNVELAIEMLAKQLNILSKAINELKKGK